MLRTGPLYQALHEPQRIRVVEYRECVRCRGTENVVIQYGVMARV